MNISKNYQTIVEQVDQAAQKVGRKGSDIAVVVAGKYATGERLKEVIYAGATMVGENRVQDLLVHQEYTNSQLTTHNQQLNWHFIGHLQTNKINKVIGNISLLQSLDNLHLAEKLQKKLLAEDKTLDVLIEINIADDPKKFGVKKENIQEFISKLKPFSSLKIRGFMTVGKIWVSEKEARIYFREMKNLFDSLQSIKQDNFHPTILSMGMSQDFVWAIEEGASMVRIGRGIFLH